MRSSTEKATTLIAHTWIYGIGEVLRASTSLILLPIYTTWLRPAEYGTAELITIVVDFVALFVGSRIGFGIFKYYNDAVTAEDRRRVLATALSLLCAVNAAGILFLFGAAGPLSDLLNAPEGFSGGVRLLSLNLLCAAFNEVFFCRLRLTDRPREYVLTNVVRFAAQLAINVWLIVFLDLGYLGIILGSLCSNLLVSLVFAVRLLPSVGFAFDRTVAARLLTFSYPIVISALGMYYISYSSRYFLTLWHGLEAIGIYALAYKIGLTLLSLVWAPFSTSWSAKQFEYAREPDAPQFFGTVFFYVNLVLVTAASGLIVTAPHLLRLVSAPDFWPAIALVPWIAGASLLQAWTEYFRIGIFHHSKTILIAYGTFLTGALITILYFWAVPAWGAPGAAVATFSAFLFRFGYFFVLGQRLFPIRLPVRRLAATITWFAAVSWILSQWALPDGPGLFVKAAGVLAAAGILALSPAVPRAHRERAGAWIARRWRERATQGT